MPSQSYITQDHLDKIQGFYDSAPVKLGWAARSYRKLLAHYYNLLIPSRSSVLEIGCASGELLAEIKAARKVGVDLSPRQIETAKKLLPADDFHIQSGEALNLDEKFDVIILSDTLNLAADVQQIFAQIQKVSHENTRLIVNYYSSLWRPILTVAGCPASWTLSSTRV